MYSEQSQQKDSHRLDTTVSLTGTSLCTYAIEPTCTERYARWCERSGLVSPSYSIAGNSMGLASIAIVILSDLCYDKAKDDSPESFISSLITSLTND